MTQRYPPLVSALVILSYHGFRLVEARKECPVENLEEVDHEGFFSHGIRVEWDAHRLGWASAGIATFIATVASLTNIYLHCSNYNKPLEQRQIIRILLMPTIYSLVSFFSYRYYREYVYFAVVRDIYEAFVLAAFLILCLLYVGRSPLEQQKVMAQKEKSKLSFPFCCFRYRPSKPNFLIATKWSVLQYVLLRPLISAAAIVTDSLGVFCAASYHYSFANVWLLIITFVSATIALYGLLIIYHLAKEDLQGHRPLMKFMSIKIGVFLVFYQGFLISFLDHLGLIHPTTYWSKSNIADGINALATTIEMALIAVFQIFAFSYTEYKALIKGSEVDKKATPWKNFLHSQDYRDFARDIRVGSKFFFNKLRGKARLNVRDPKDETNDLDFQRAFGLHIAQQTIITGSLGRSYDLGRSNSIKDTKHHRKSSDLSKNDGSGEDRIDIDVDVSSTASFTLESHTYEDIQLNNYKDLNSGKEHSEFYYSKELSNSPESTELKQGEDNRFNSDQRN